MPINWDEAADSKLLLAILKVENISPKLDLVANELKVTMGQDVDKISVKNRLYKLKKKAGIVGNPKSEDAGDAGKTQGGRGKKAVGDGPKGKKPRSPRQSKKRRLEDADEDDGKENKIVRKEKEDGGEEEEELEEEARQVCGFVDDFENPEDMEAVESGEVAE